MWLGLEVCCSEEEEEIRVSDEEDDATFRSVVNVT
jgi:hypothetical protein